MKLLLLLLAALLAGCASPTQKISDADRSRYGTVFLDQQVQKPPQMYYLGPEGALGLSFGLIGALATQSTREAGTQRFVEAMEQHGVRIENIVINELFDAIRLSGKLVMREQPGPDVATFRVIIEQYGFSVPNTLSSKLVPMLYVKCEMVDPSGRVVWSASDRTLSLGNPAEAIPAEEMRNDPKLVLQQWTIAAKAIAAKILQEF
jgi:hypothetical protein